MSVFLDIRGAIAAAMSAVPALADGNVQTGRKGPMPAEWLRSINVRTDGHTEQPATLNSAPVDWESTYLVEIQARATATLDAEAAVDEVLALVYARLKAVDAATLSALGVESFAIEPTISRELYEGDTELGEAQISLRITHRTQPATLTAWS